MVPLTTNYTLSTGPLCPDRPVRAPNDATNVDAILGGLLSPLSSLPSVFLVLTNGGVSDTKNFLIGFDSAGLVASIVFLLLPKGGVSDDRNPLDPWLL